MSSIRVVKNKMNFPSICVDNFYDNPDEVREFALSLDYSETENGKYPGKRTKSLDTISNEFFHSFCQRLFSVYYDFQIPISWKVSTQFQLIEPFDLVVN